MNRQAFSPDISRPATSISEELATLQEEFGSIQGIATRVIAGGTLSFIERSYLTLRLRAIRGRVDELLEVLG